MNITLPQVKSIAKSIRKKYGYTQDGIMSSHSEILELIASSFEQKNYNSLVSLFRSEQQDITKKIYFGGTRTGKTINLLNDISPLALSTKKEQEKIFVMALESEESLFRDIVPYARFLIIPTLFDMREKKELTESFFLNEECIDNKYTTVVIDGVLDFPVDLYLSALLFENFNKQNIYIATQSERTVNYFTKEATICHSKMQVNYT